MRTIQTEVYKFHELSETAKAHAKTDYAVAEGNGGYPWADDAMKSLKALAAHFGGKLSDYSIDYSGAVCPSFASFDMPEMEANEIQRRLDALGSLYDPETLKGLGDCKLTGYCADESAIDGFRVAFLRDGEHDLNALMQEAFATWLAEAQDDYLDFYEDGQFSDHCEANNYEFYADGEMV